MRIEPAPFFASKNRAFWNLQLAGWGGSFLLRVLNTVANGLPYNQLILILITTITGFSISLILSVIYRQLIQRSPVVTWGGTVIVLFLAVTLHAGIETWVQGLYYGGTRETSFVQRFLGITYIPLTLLGGWSALYYAINFFLTVERQADRLERLEAQATAAQLAMLRYQLNPHFLFNTLNSISTLVLLKQTGPANAMLTRLSSFLRHTLITEPGSQVTLSRKSRRCSSISISNGCGSKSGCAPISRLTTPRSRRACRRCCSNRWSKTRSNTPSARRKKARAFR